MADPDELTALIAETAFAPDLWPQALAGIAAAVGGWSAQLLGHHVGNGFSFIYSSALDPKVYEAMVPAGLGDPERHPRASVNRAEVGRVILDHDLISEAERRAHPFYRTHFAPAGMDYGVLVKLHEASGVVLLSVVRREGQGAFGEAERARVGALTPALRAAVDLRLRIETAQAGAACAGMEALSRPALFCDVNGRILHATALGEALVERGDRIRVRDGRLEATHAVSDSVLKAAMHQLAFGRAKTPRRLALRAHGGDTYWADLAALPSSHFCLRQGAAILLMLDPLPDLESRSRRLQDGLRLSAAESAVALAVADGMKVRDIAEARKVSYTTVRNQLRAIFDKTGARTQAALTRLVITVGGG